MRADYNPKRHLQDNDRQSKTDGYLGNQRCGNGNPHHQEHGMIV